MQALASEHSRSAHQLPKELAVGAHNINIEAFVVHSAVEPPIVIPNVATGPPSHGVLTPAIVVLQNNALPRAAGELSAEQLLGQEKNVDAQVPLCDVQVESMHVLKNLII